MRFKQILPEGTTLVDWPLDYDDLEPYYTAIEHIAGISGDSDAPFVRRSQPHPMPALRPSRVGLRGSPPA